jgi:2-dehydro-3-deoxyphosphogluconate aldolase/(4S)-4-hydroxy-2-oxoglutarate aldolase
MAAIAAADVVQTISAARLVAIVRLDDLSRAEELVRALLRGGVRAVEFTLTNPDAPGVVRDLLTRLPEFHDGRAVLGLGSVRTAAELQMGLECGAQFLVSPICREPLVRAATAAGVAMMPGAFSPTEVASAVDWGAEIVKVFPARALGPGYVKDLLAPMPELRLMPTGGVDLGSMGAYLAAGAVAVGVGGQLVQPGPIARGEWAEIERSAREHVLAASGTSVG